MNKYVLNYQMSYNMEMLKDMCLGIYDNLNKAEKEKRNWVVDTIDTWKDEGWEIEILNDDNKQTTFFVRKGVFQCTCRLFIDEFNAE